MIKEIEIENFRGIKHGKLNRFRQFNLLVGPNNSGKSAVLEALYLASTATRLGSLTLSDGFSSQNYQVTLPAKDLLNQSPASRLVLRHHYGAGALDDNRFEADVLKITLTDTTLPIDSFELSGVNRPLTADEASHINLFRVQSQPDVPLSTLTQQLTAQAVETWPEEKQLIFYWQRDLTYFYKGTASWWLSGKLPPAEHVFYYDFLNVHEHFSTSFYAKMLATVPGWHHKIGRYFRDIFGLSYPFNVVFLPPKGSESMMQGWIAPEESFGTTIDAWGDGARAAFKLLTPLVALAYLATPAKPAMVLWEEPELFQNPQTLGKLLQAVVEIVRDKPIQIFMASHSLEVLAYLTQMLENETLPREKSIGFLLNLEQGELQSTWFDADNLITLLESGLDPRVWDDFVPPVRFRLSPEEVEE